MARLALLPFALWLGWMAPWRGLSAGAAPVQSPVCQAEPGLTGRVIDLATGAPLPGALVGSGSVATTTDGAGAFRLALPPGRHDLRVVADGFVGATLTGVVAPAAAELALGLPPAHLDESTARAVAARLTARAPGEVALAGATGVSELAVPITDVPAEIRVLMPDGSIVAMETDEYLKGVVPAEMGYVFRRAIEALKAQAIASRTYAATGCLADSAGDRGRCEPGLDANVDTTTRTQVWRPVHYDVTDEAVLATHGQVARDGAALIRALYFARTSLRTLDSEASPCCGGTVTRYLRSVSSPEAFAARWGHGAGLSQEGAAVFGAWGATAEEIVEHYYSGVRVDPAGPVRQDGGVAAASPPEPPIERPDSAGGTLAGRLDLAAADLAPTAGGAVMRTESAVAAAGPGSVVLESPTQSANFPFMALAAQWDGAAPPGAAVELAVQTSRDGVIWSAWTPLSADDADAPQVAADSHWTRLLVARGRHVRLRAVLSATDMARPVVNGVTLHYLNSDAGPAAPAVAAQAAEPRVITRADWGADEALRFKDGQEVWPAEYTRPLAQIVHHTVTTNDPADPAAVVRSIYYYHAVTRAWGDIGYNFLVDHRGNVYEGRYGGERNGQISQGGHALQYNANTIGVALLGTFTDVRPSSAARAALVSLLAAKGQRYGLDPYAAVTLAGTSFPYRLLGHRDVLPGHTACPGAAFHPDLPAIRQAVAAAMAEASPTRPPASATPTRPPATPIPPTPVPGECPSVVVNGGFEAEDASWVRNRAAFTGYDVYRGSRAMFVGLRNDEADTAQTFASVQQAIQLPARVGTVRLRFAARTNGHDADRRYVRILDAAGAVLALGSLSLPATSGWTAYDLDVTGALAGRGGQAVRVYFAVINNGDGQRSYMRLDEVALVVCAPPGPTSPTARPSASPARPSDTATPRPSATVGATATPAPPACANLLSGGDFEAPGLADWTVSGNQPVQRISEPARGGGALALGLAAPGTDAFDYAAAARDVPAPARVISATLSLATRPLALGPGDAFVLELRNPADGSRRLLLGPAPVGEPGVWTEHRLELDPAMLGQSAQVYLAVLNRAQAGGLGAVTAVAVDDLRLVVCAAAGPSALAGAVYLPALPREP